MKILLLSRLAVLLLGALAMAAGTFLSTHLPPCGPLAALDACADSVASALRDGLDLERLGEGLQLLVDDVAARLRSVGKGEWSRP